MIIKGLEKSQDEEFKKDHSIFAKYDYKTKQYVICSREKKFELIKLADKLDGKPENETEIYKTYKEYYSEINRLIEKMVEFKVLFKENEKYFFDDCGRNALQLVLTRLELT